MDRPYVVGMDIGGTNTVFGIVDARGNILSVDSIKTQAYKEFGDYVAAVAEKLIPMIEAVGGTNKIKGMGIGAPNGNYHTGNIEHSANLPWKGIVPLGWLIEKKTGLPTKVTNDANAAAIGEMIYGVARGMKNFIVLTLGTGVGSGIVIDGKLYYGKNGFAGEFGHIPFFDNETICACGKKGCLETEVSGIAIEEKIVKLIKSGVNTILRDKYDRGERIHIDDIIAAAQNDDNLSIELIEEVGEKLGKAVAFLINTFNPETVIVGGNLAAAGDYIMLPLKSSTNKYSLNLVYKDTKFRQSKMSENANAWGVAMLIHNKIIGL